MGVPASDPNALARRIAELTERIRTGCRAVGRDPRTVRVLPVTKGREVGFLDALAAQGFPTFGESRIGELARRIRDRPSYGWEFIGRFRPADAGLLVRSTQMVHSVVDPAQADALERECRSLGVHRRVLLQVNVAGESQKQGVPPDAAVAWARTWAYPNLELAGLLVLGPRAGTPEGTRSVFARGRSLFDRIRSERGPGFSELSMGMSGDLEVAVAEGATVVRVGTYLYEAVGPAGPG